MLFTSHAYVEQIIRNGRGPAAERRERQLREALALRASEPARDWRGGVGASPPPAGSIAGRLSVLVFGRCVFCPQRAA